MRSAPVRRVALLLAVVAVVAARRGWLQPALSAEELAQCTAALLEQLPVEPLGENSGVTSEQVKLDRPYAWSTPSVQRSISRGWSLPLSR